MFQPIVSKIHFLFWSPSLIWELSKLSIHCSTAAVIWLCLLTQTANCAMHLPTFFPSPVASEICQSSIILKKPTAAKQIESMELLRQEYWARWPLNNTICSLKEGTQTAFRGKKAHQSISREIVELCEVIEMNSRITSADGCYRGILFGDLFNIYNRISNKVNNHRVEFSALLQLCFQVVGLLIRARKYKLVDFEGETLFQGKNDKTPIYLLR